MDGNQPEAAFLVEAQACKLSLVVISHSRRQPAAPAAALTASISAVPMPWSGCRLSSVTISHASPAMWKVTSPATSPVHLGDEAGQRGRMIERAVGHDDLGAPMLG